MQAMRSGGAPDRTAMQKAIKELQDDQDKELKKIFSDTQWPAY
jgi:hypothetical protein